MAAYYACAAPPPLANRSVGNRRAGPTLRREAWVAIRAGESRGGAEGVAAATVGGIKASGGRATGNRVNSSKHQIWLDTGHVGMFCCPGLRCGERTVSWQSALLSCFWPRMHQLSSSPSSLDLSPSCRSGSCRGECATCFGFHQPFQVDSRTKCHRFCTHTPLNKYLDTIPDKMSYEHFSRWRSWGRSSSNEKTAL